MSILHSLQSLVSRKSLTGISQRFLSVFAAHGVDQVHIPRWVPAIVYKDLQSESQLLAALTPQVLDETADLFGLHPGWLEGASDLVLMPVGERDNPRALLDLIAAAVRASEASGSGWNPAPLRIITDVKSLLRGASHRQWLVLVIVQAIGDQGDGPVCRAQVYRYPFDWSNLEQRLQLKAITWLVHHHLKTVVPLYQVSTETLERVLAGQEIPSVALNRSVITDPSLDDYIHDPATSRVAKEVDELQQVLDLVDATGLRDYQFQSPEPPIAEQSSDLVQPDQAEQKPTPNPGGKREAQKAQWHAITAAAKTLWVQFPETTIADMVARLKRLPHLKASALSDSAIQKHISQVAPEGVRGKPGRKPKKST